MRFICFILTAFHIPAIDLTTLIITIKALPERTLVSCYILGGISGNYIIQELYIAIKLIINLKLVKNCIWLTAFIKKIPTNTFKNLS